MCMISKLSKYHKQFRKFSNTIAGFHLMVYKTVQLSSNDQDFRRRRISLAIRKKRLLIVVPKSDTPTQFCFSFVHNIRRCSTPKLNP